MAQHDAAGQHRLLTHQAMSLVEKYDGEDDALAWLDTVETLAELYYWTEDVCLRLCMKGPAQRWVHQRTFRDWEDFQRQFARRFGETRETAVARLSRCYQHYDESPEAFADRFLENAERAGRTEDGALVYQFLGRLKPELRAEAARKQPQSIAEAVHFCNYWLGAMADSSEEPEYSTTAGTYTTQSEDLQALAARMQLYYMKRQEEQDLEISRLRHALQQQHIQTLAATRLYYMSTELDNTTDDSDEEDYGIEPIITFNYIKSCGPPETTESGQGKCFDDTEQTTKPITQELTATSQFPVPIGAMAITEVCSPADQAPVSLPLQQSSLISEDLKPPLAEAATQEKAPMRILSSGSKPQRHTTWLNDGKGNCLLRLVPNGQLHNGKPLNDPVCWQPSTTVPPVPPLPWPPPCLESGGAWCVGQHRHALYTT